MECCPVWTFYFLDVRVDNYEAVITKEMSQQIELCPSGNIVFTLLWVEFGWRFYMFLWDSAKR